MTIARRHRRIPGRSSVRAAVLLAGAAMVAGCAVFPPRGGSESRPVEQVAVPEPAPSSADAPAVISRKAPPKMTRSTSAVPAREEIDLSVLYLERIRIPAGSDLTIRTQTAEGTPTIKRTTVAEGMPYKVSVPVSTAKDNYPMTIEATLKSTIGHEMTGSVTLQDRPTGPVEIVIRTKSE